MFIIYHLLKDWIAFYPTFVLAKTKMATQPVLGLRHNWKQFALLVAINALVGGLVGMERSIFPEYAESQFGIVSKTALLSFIAAFGLSKAMTNFFTGRWANALGRKNMLSLGWAVALPVPILLINADQWHWVVFANVLLGISQGLSWSSTIVMKIDLVGEKDRGLAMGLNEFSGYLAVGLMAFFTGYLAQHYGIVPYPFYAGLAIAITGLLLTLLWVKDTGGHVLAEHRLTKAPDLIHVFWDTTYRHKTLGSITQAGLVNNLNDGMIWGLLPVYLLSLEYRAQSIATVVSIYPVVWGVGQLATGKMGDIYSRKKMMVAGMALQGIAILGMTWTTSYLMMMALAVVLGLGTALVYPTFLSTIAGVVSPVQRAESMGTFRLWRDLGYVFGALFSGIVADVFGTMAAISAVGIITLISAIIIQYRMPETTEDCIQPVDLQKALEGHSKVLIADVRTEEEYQRYHVPGSVHLSPEDFSQVIQTLKEYALIVAVCGKGGGRSERAALQLKQMGLPARWLCGGTMAWDKETIKIES